MPENYSDKTIYLTSDAGTEHLLNTSGWYLRNNNNIRKKKEETNLDVERNKTLRIKDSTIKLPGVMRFNSTLQQFQGYTGNLIDGSDGWTSFQTFKGIDGKDGVNSISEMVGLNVSSDANTFGIFKDIVSETLATSTTADTILNNQVENIYTTPSYTYTSFNYASTNQNMDLTNKTLTFIPYQQTSFKVFVRENDIYPPVSYYSHDKVRDLNDGKIDTNNHFKYYLQGNRFTFYNTTYSYVYIHENGYLNFVGGDSSLLTGNYPNHFSAYRISAFLNNLVNNSDTGETNQADIYVGQGPYGETVITYNNFSAIEIDPNNSSNSISDNYNNFQIRLWTDQASSNFSSTYSDDHYPTGTIQISYGKSEHQSPLVGISNQQTYDETTFVPLPFSNLLDTDYTEVTGLGVPKLNATFVLEIPDASQASILASNSNFQDLGQFENSGNLYKLIVKNSNWTSSYSEIYNGSYYYTRIMDLGSVSGIQKFYCAIQGLHDTAISDISNREQTDNPIDLSNWDTLDKFTDISSIYTASRSKDYLEVYSQNPFNTGLHNSYLCSIQMRYSDSNVISTGGSATTRLYTGSTEKRLLVKVIYKLRSDVDTPVGNTSFNNATDITLSSPITISQKFTDNGNDEFHFIPGSSDYFKFTVDVSKSYQIELFDNSPDEASRNNYGLSLELYKETGEDTEPILYKSSTKVNLNISNNLNTYPGTTIDQELEFSNSQSSRTFYAVVSGNMKSYYYGIRIKETTSVSLTTNILTLTVPNVNYNSLSSAERESLKDEIKKIVADSSSSDTIDLSTISRVILERSTASDGTNNIVATVVFTVSTIGELNDIVTNFDTTPPSVTFNVNTVSTTREISNPAANTTTIANLPTDTIPIDDDDSGPPEPPVSQDYTTSDILTLKKANFLSSNARLHNNYTDKNYFDLYYHTSVTVSDKIYYCYLFIDLNTTGSSLDLTLNVFNKSESNVFSSVLVESITFSDVDDLISYPFNIFNQQNKVTVLYGSGTTGSKSFNLKQYSVTNLDNVINLQLENTFSGDSGSSIQNTIFKKNDGRVDSLGNIYAMEVNGTEISIVKFDTSLNKTTQTTISGISYSGSNYLSLYSSRDRFNSHIYLYLLNKASSTDYTVKKINLTQTEYPRFCVGFNYYKTVSYIRLDGTLYFRSDSTTANNNYNVVNNNNNLNEVEDVINMRDIFIARTKTGNIYFWKSSIITFATNFQNLTNVTSMISNEGAVAFTVQSGGNKSISTAGTSNEYGASGKRFNYGSSQFTNVDLGNEISSVYATSRAFAALTTSGKIKSWGQFTSNTDATVVSEDYGGNHEAESGITSDLVFTEIFAGHNSFAALTNDRKLYTWGNLHSSFKGNRNPTDSSNNNSNFISNVYVVRRTKLAWAVLVPDDNFTESKKTYKAMCFGGEGYDGADYDNLLVPNDFNQNNYGEFMQYYDYDSSATDKSTSRASENSNIKELYANDYAFAALTWDNEVITWGSSTPSFNNGGSPYYKEKNSGNWISVKDELASGVNEIVSNPGSFMAIKNDKIVVWGSEYSGGNPYIQTNSSPVDSKMNYSGLTSSNVIPHKTGYAIFQNGSVNFIGSNIKLEGSGFQTTAIDNVLDVQSKYQQSPNNDFTTSYNEEPFVIIKNDMSVVIIGSNIYSARGDLTSNYSPINVAEESLINDDLVNYDYILNNINQRNNIVFGCLKENYYYLKFDTNYKLFRNRRVTTIYSFTELNNEDNIVFLQFEFIEGNEDYLLIVYQDLTDTTNKLVVLKLGDIIDDIKLLTHSISVVQGVKIIQGKLYNYYYSAIEPKKYRVDVYDLGASSITGPSASHEIYNVDDETIENEIFMPQDYTITEAFGNALTVDNNTATPSFYMVVKNDTLVNTNKYNYFLFQYDINYESGRNIDFGEYAEIEANNIITVEDKELDELKKEEVIVDSLVSDSLYLVRFILNESIMVIYTLGKSLFIKIYDEYDFVENEIDLLEDEVYNIQVFTNLTIQTLTWETDSKMYFYQFEYQGCGEITEIVNNNFDKVAEKNITNILNLEDSIIFGYFSSEDNKYLIVKYEDGEKNTILEFPTSNNIEFIQYLDNKIFIFNERKTYYTYDLSNNDLESFYLIYPVINENIIVLNNDVYYLSQLKESYYLIKNNDLVLNLNKLEVEILDFKLLDEEKIMLVYSSPNSKNKTIIIYDTKNGNVKNNNYNFDFWAKQEETFLLFDTREHNHKITIRYLNLNLETLYLNQFENEDYSFKKIELLHEKNNIIEFWAIQKDNNDIEESYMIERFIYKNISKGYYPTYSYEIDNSFDFEETTSDENISLQIEDVIANNYTPSVRSVLTENNLVLELVAEVSVVQSDNSYKYLFEHKQTGGTGVGTFNSDNDYRLKEGTYILKNVPYNYPLAILVKTATGDKNMITYRGLSYNNLNPNNVGSSLVKQVTEDSVTEFYYFYYGDIEIKVLGNFGTVSFYSYNNGYMGGEKKFVYQTGIDRNPDIESNKLYEREGNNRILKFPFYGADPKNSNFVIGRAKGNTYTDQDSGTNLYSYVKSYYKTNEETCFYLRSNGIPNYQPSIFGKELKGNWINEVSSLELENKNYYSIYYQNRGWFDTSNILQGTVIKIPIEPRIANENIYTSNVTFQENFWFNDDIYWKTLMDDTNYSEKLLTPMGPIAIAVNGVSIYNFAIMQNTVTDTYSSSTLVSGNFEYETSSNLVTTLSTNNSTVVINGVENSITNTQIYDNQGGTVDLNHHYHYHYYPIVLEGQLFFGTVNSRDPENKILFLETNEVSNNDFKMYIGHTYYLNVNEASNRNTNNENVQVGFAINNSSNNYVEEYNFNNTLLRSGNPGLGIGSYVKFKIPDTLTTQNTLQLVRVRDDNNQSANTQDLIDSSYGGFYNKTTGTNTTPHIKLDYRPKNMNLDIFNERFLFKNEEGEDFNTSNLLYFEKDVIYTINLGNDYSTTEYELGFKVVKNSNIEIYNPTIFSTTTEAITLRFDEEITGLFIYNTLDEFDNSGANYPTINVYQPESIHYYTRVDTEQFKFYNYNQLGNFNFNGQLEWEDAYSYLSNKKQLTGPQGHSPLLGYAFDGFPIYGPLGYDKSTSQYYSNDESTIPVKFLKSSYTNDTVDSNGNPTYTPNFGDLDFCNGIFSKTPEFPQGIYHYICTIKLDVDGNPALEEDSSYGFRNVPKQIIKPAYPYVIGAYKGVPELSNFPWATPQGATSNTNIEKKKFTFNFKSLRSDTISVNGKTTDSISITQDEKNLNLLVNPQNFKWNFSNSIQTSIFGRDDTIFGNKISELVSSSTDTTLKCYGRVSKWTSSGLIQKGTCLTLTNKTVNSETLLCAKTYTETGLSEQEEHVAILGVALNDVTEDGGEVYVCEEGITSIVVNNTANIKCSSYGVISVLSGTTGRVIALDANTNILSNTPIVGIFLETKNVEAGNYCLFKVKTNYEFN